MKPKQYWKIHKYMIDYEYNPRYPLYAEITIQGEKPLHLWRLPEGCISSDDYDWSDAIKVDSLF